MLQCIAFVLLLLFHLVGTALSQSLPVDTLTVFDTSGSTQTNRPVSIAHAFRQGDITSYAQAYVGGTPFLTQCDVKNRWPDGSLKFAIVSFIIPNLPANGSVTVSFANQTTGNNTGFLTQSDMLAAGYNFDGQVQMTGASAQTVSARTILTAGAFRYWLQGPIVTAVIIEDRTLARAYDKDFGDGSKALHPIFEAWFYPQNNTVDMGYTVENIWASSTASKSMRDLSYSFVLTSGNTAPVTRFTQATFTHIGRSRWYKRFWVGTAPGSIRIDHNLAYLESTKAIPNYDTSITIATSLLTSQYSSWIGADQTVPGATYGIGNYNKALNAAGAADWIGLMHTWETIYLMTMDDRMLEKTLGNADLAGRIPYYFREADTLAGSGDYFDAPLTGSVDTFGRPVSINARRQVTLQDLTQTCSGAAIPDLINTGSVSLDGWAVTRDHMPALGYVPYLVTGRYYYLEELQLQAAYVLGHKTGCMTENYHRNGSDGYFHDSQVRGDAWAYRTTIQAAFLSPDGTPEKTYFEDKLENNIAMDEGGHNLTLSNSAKLSHWNYGQTTQIPSYGVSPIGFWWEGNNGLFVTNSCAVPNSAKQGSAPWEEYFLMAAWGMARDMGYSNYGKILRFNGYRLIGQLLDPAANHYLIERYVASAIGNTSNAWVQTFAEFGTYFLPPPSACSVGWTTGDNVDHGYGYIALGTLSFLYNDVVASGYKGSDAYNFYRANKPGLNRYATDSPKWAILPRATGSGDITPPNPPTSLTVN